MLEHFLEMVKLVVSLRFEPRMQSHSLNKKRPHHYLYLREFFL